jgi:hypothetical protein
MAGSRNFYTIPDQEDIVRAHASTPEYMYPSYNPFIVIEEGSLSDDVCDEIVEHYMKEDPYPFSGCGATTRECPRPLHDFLNPIHNFGLDTNRVWWDFDLRDEGAWLQTYEVGDSYQQHTDGWIGQTRKLTVIAMLTDPEEYDGGELHMYSPPSIFQIPKSRGTMVALPPWVVHSVTPIERGIRQTINLGFWGPKFR